MSDQESVLLEGAIGAVPVDQILGLVTRTSVTGRVLLDGAVAGYLDLLEGQPVAVRVQNRPTAAEVAPLGHAIAGGDPAERLVALLTDTVAELAMGARRFRVLAGVNIEPGETIPDLLDSAWAVADELERAGGAEVTSAVVPGRADFLPPSCDAARVDRIGWWLLGVADGRRTVAELALRGGLTRLEVVRASRRLIEAGLLVEAAEVEAPPAPAEAVLEAPAMAAARVAVADTRPMPMHEVVADPVSPMTLAGTPAFADLLTAPAAAPADAWAEPSPKSTVEELWGALRQSDGPAWSPGPAGSNVAWPATNGATGGGASALAAVEELRGLRAFDPTASDVPAQ